MPPAPTKDEAAKKESGSFYAWSPIKSGKRDKDGNVEAVEVKPGDSVSADQLGLSDEQFQQLVDGGSIRKAKYPDMPEGYQDSPLNRMRELAAEAAEEGEDEVVNPELAGMPQSSPHRSDAAAGAAITSPAPPSA